MTDLELIFSMLGEASTTEIVKTQNPKGFIQNQKAAKQGGSVAGNARLELESKTGEKVVSKDNYLPEGEKTLTIKAKDFATELTSHNVVEKDLKGEYSISNEHIENNKAVRKMLLERGVKPEALPPSEDVKIYSEN